MRSGKQRKTSVGHRIKPPLRGGFLSPGPEELHRILLEDSVGCNEDHVFQVGLGNQQPVERVTMMSRKAENRQRVLVGNGKGTQPLICHAPRNMSCFR